MALPAQYGFRTAGVIDIQNQLLLQAPGVTQDSFGQLHVRGDHGNLQFRINGVQLPEGINVFGQALQTRLADSVSLITGAYANRSFRPPFSTFYAGAIVTRGRPARSNPAARSRCMAAAAGGLSRRPRGAAYQG